MELVLGALAVFAFILLIFAIAPSPEKDIPVEGEVVELIDNKLKKQNGVQTYVVAIRGVSESGKKSIVYYDVSEEVFNGLKLGDYYKHNPED